MTKLGRSTTIGCLFIGALVIGALGLAATSWAQTHPPIVEQIAKTYGLDSFGQHRFLSSRAGANGPTMGDIMGTSVLDDDGFYSRAWYTARRI